MADLLLPRGMERSFSTYQHIEGKILGTLFCRKFAGDYTVDAIFSQSQVPKEIADAYFAKHQSYLPLKFYKPSKEEVRQAKQPSNVASYIHAPELREYQRRTVTTGLGLLLVLPEIDKPHSAVPHLWSPVLAGIHYIDESTIPDRLFRNREIYGDLRRIMGAKGQTNVHTPLRKQIS